MSNNTPVTENPRSSKSVETATHVYKYAPAKKHPHPHPHPPGGTPVPPGTRGLLKFRGKGSQPRDPDTFTVLCGDEPPVITGGYAKWENVARPLRRSLTIFQGYEPALMKIAIRFGFWTTDGWDTTQTAGRAVERDIETLEWMAGANFVAGASPYVFASSLDGNGKTTGLISPYYQQTVGISGYFADSRLWPWVLSGGVEWGPAWRNDRGFRVYQEASFTLTNFQGLGSVKPRTTRGGYFISKPGRDTPLLIAEAPSAHALYPGRLAYRIVGAPRNKHLKLRSIYKHVKHHKKVWVPSHDT